MSVNIGVTIDAEKALQFLGQMPERLQGAIDRILKKAGALIEREAKIVTPVDTGRLRASIHTVNEHLRSEVGTNVKYAVYVHEGTQYMAPRPFMLAGVENAKSDIEDITNSEIERALV